MRGSTYRIVPAVEKAARLLAELREDEGLGISELARRITASKGTVRDILLTLVSHDLVARDADGRFRRGGRGFDLTHLARPHLDALLAAFGETALLGIVTDGGVEIAARAEPSSDLHMSAPIGRRLPANIGAHAKVLTGGADIGYDDEEYLAGVRAVAAPIVDARGRRIAALIVVGFKERLDMRTLKKIGEACAREAAALSARLGRREQVA
ncbi:MAG TPA: IclR family transcriptional regulator C-terminal domain-containing protein [Candidatus Limnocylindria bacterium]|nr:IclR family transcriptional regulator C-terminal domain-containing protein [Candidatus Limnocylindria bacterium]